MIGSDERVVAYLTGEGLKTLDAARDSFQMDVIEPSLESFESIVEARIAGETAPASVAA